ncbi:MAG TPA: SDR family NAD(P)-dependent oxidoreductase [Terriglobales bacterium]|jgi:FlaA1/EpsC-like NDP-sugar epimerase|nr:SDR family NAD(P)-dependent oxidoreductase [Terriglobales bacterium]
MSLPQKGNTRKPTNQGSSPRQQWNSNSTAGVCGDSTWDRANASEFPAMDLNDLLGREAVQIELDSVRQAVTGKVVLVTGAAGSIGSELCRQILVCGPATLVCLDHNETGLFYLQRELDASRSRAAIVYCVEDFGNSDPMRRIFSAHQVQIVFHAAGYKHVPMMEQNLRAVLENNVFGLVRLLEASEATGCEAFVLISSDKAVNPTSVMGCTKRLGELILASCPNGSIRCISVRFGNVLGSQGSVVPVFLTQITRNRALTVTHRDITRFFITVDEAVSLLLQASAIGKRGDILSLEMGKPVRILDLAQRLRRQFGKTGKDVKIVFSCLRPGEKLHEELFYKDEQELPTSCDRIKRASGPIVSWPKLKSKLDALRLALYTADDDKLRAQIQGIIPEYRFETTPAHARGKAIVISRGTRYSPGSDGVLPKNLIAQRGATDTEIPSPGSS